MLNTEKLVKMSAEKRQKAILIEKIKCFTDYEYLIETYFTVDAGGKRKPFKLYPHQKEALKAYLSYQNNITMKTRQMGFTTFTSAYIACLLINKNNFKTLIISKEMNSAKDFVKNIKDILDNARRSTLTSNTPGAISWLIPDYLEGYNNKESFTLENGSYVRAQGTTEDSGRGISGLHLAVVDEVAFIDRKFVGKMEDIWSALGPALSTVKGKAIMISTPFGSSGWYYDTYTNAKSMGFHIIDAHWTKHPMFNMGQYQWIFDETLPQKGYLKFYNEKWPEELFDKDTGMFIKMDKASYPFICDGQIRSPWYDHESKKLGPRKTACELNCSFVGTGGEVLGPDKLRDMKLFAETQEYINPYDSGFLSKYKEYLSPDSDGKYVLAADVATGDGNDYSTFVILNLETLKIHGTFKAQLFPNAFAAVIYTVAKRFNTCHVVVENAGGGGSTLQELKEANYPNIYYSTLNKKDEQLGVKKRKIGLWVSNDVRTKGGDKLEELISSNTINVNCLDLVEEFYNWIWDKDGKRRHAPNKHDDLIMALQHAVYYQNFVYKRNLRNRENFKNTFQRQINGWDSDSPNGTGMMFKDEITTKINSESPSKSRQLPGDFVDRKNNYAANVNNPEVKRVVKFL